MEIATLALFAVLGLVVAMIGTLVGAGGGFILTPILVFMLPHEPADRLTAISMAVVFFNAASGTFAYARMRRIDFAAGWRFVIAAIPGAFAGAVLTNYISRNFYDRALGGTLVVIALFLLTKLLNGRSQPSASLHHEDAHFTLDAKGRRIGAGLSALVGLMSSMLGIGGGIVHVPALVYILRYPIHIATATSHFVLACTSLVAVAVHVGQGSYEGHYLVAGVLAAGAIVGAQLGAKLSQRIRGPFIVSALVIALLAAGSRIIALTF